MSDSEPSDVDEIPEIPSEGDSSDEIVLEARQICSATLLLDNGVMIHACRLRLRPEHKTRASPQQASANPWFDVVEPGLLLNGQTAPWPESWDRVRGTCVVEINDYRLRWNMQLLYRDTVERRNSQGNVAAAALSTAPNASCSTWRLFCRRVLSVELPP